MQAKSFHIFFFMLFLWQGVSAQVWQWARVLKFGYIDYNVKCDSNNNVIVLGNTANSQYPFAPFACKIDPAGGSIVWLQRYANNSDKITLTGDYTIKPDGHILFILHYSATGTLKISPSVTLTNNSLSFFPLYLTEMDENGSVINALKIGEDTSASGYYTTSLSSFSADQGNTYLDGSTSIDSSKIAGAKITPWDPFIAKLDIAGNLTWLRQFAVPKNYGRAFGFNISCLFNSGRIYTMFQSKYNQIGQDFYRLSITDYSSNYVKKDSISANGLYLDYLISDNINNIYYSGTLFDTSTVGPYKLSNTNNQNFNFCIAKFDSSLHCLWAKTLGNNNNNAGVSGGIASDTANNVFAAVDFYDTITISNNTYYSAGPYLYGAAIVKYLPNGNIGYSLPLVSWLGSVEINKLISDKCGNIYILGNFTGDTGTVRVKFGSTIGLQASASDSAHFFLAKLYTGTLNFTTKPICSFDSLYANASPSLDSIVWTFQDGTILHGRNVRYNFTTKPYAVTLGAYCRKGCSEFYTDIVKTISTIKPFTSATIPIILSASVLSPQKIKTNWLPLTGAAKYMVYLHKDGIDNLLASIADTAFYDSVTPLYTFISDSNYYFVRATDSCGDISAPSLIAKPMVLTATDYENKYAIVLWTPYAKWEKGVLKYQIQVLQNGQFIDYYDGTDTGYTDNAFFDSAQKERCYRIEAFENAGNNATSFSNEVCVPYLPTLWVPTAFTPNGDGLNDVFKVTGIGIKSFSLNIYNSWGELLYQSTDPTKGWDGTFNGKAAPEGNYLYIISVTMNNGKIITNSGTINLFR